jgi:hypothetical protein
MIIFVGEDFDINPFIRSDKYYYCKNNKTAYGKYN